MGNVDSLPVVAQVKSGFQLITGDVDGALRTTNNFLRTCPGVSQLTSVTQLVIGDVDGAAETQKLFLRSTVDTVNGVLDSTPVVGHVKGLVHYAFEDEDGGNRAMKAATRTTLVMGAGAVGMLAGGPVGAVVAGIDAGLATDLTYMVAEEKPNGALCTAIDVLANQESPDSGQVFDALFGATAGVAMDGVAGYGGGKVAKEVHAGLTNKRLYRVVDKETGSAAIESQSVKPPSRGDELWLSETSRHSESYMKHKPNTMCLEVDVAEPAYGDLRSHSIDQLGSSSKNKIQVASGERQFNLLHQERIYRDRPDRVNIGLKGPENHKILQGNVTRIREIDPTENRNWANYGEPAAYATAAAAASYGLQMKKK
jgi:hypothetical protein